MEKKSQVRYLLQVVDPEFRLHVAMEECEVAVAPTDLAPLHFIHLIEWTSRECADYDVACGC
jgi:hypothetical protein